MMTTKIQVRFFGCWAAVARSTSSVRLIPCGVISKLQARTSAIGSPIIMSMTINRIAQFRNVEHRKDLRDPLGERPAGDNVSDRDFVNITPLQLGEEILDLHCLRV